MSRSGETRSGSLGDDLARALGDPSLQVGYWLPESAAFVDAAGRLLAVPDPGSGRSATMIERDGQPLAVLVHDPAVLDDPGLVEAVSSAAGLAVANADCASTEISQPQRCHNQVMQRAEPPPAPPVRRAAPGSRAVPVRLAVAARAAAALAGLAAAAGALAVAEGPGRSTTYAGSSAAGAALALGAGLGLIAAGLVLGLSRRPGADHAAVSVANEGGRLVVTVEDNGPGDASPMVAADRVGALGGSLATGPARCRAEIPCASS